MSRIPVSKGIYLRIVEKRPSRFFLGIVDEGGRRYFGFCRVQRITGLSMPQILGAHQWAALVGQLSDPRERDRMVGVSVTLAARLLGVSRSRVQQLLKANKLSVVDVYDERRKRIGHMVTLASIAHRRRTVRPRRTQWRSTRKQL